jgi:hypothetical protein
MPSAVFSTASSRRSQPFSPSIAGLFLCLGASGPIQIIRDRFRLIEAIIILLDSSLFFLPQEPMFGLFHGTELIVGKHKRPGTLYIYYLIDLYEYAGNLHSPRGPPRQPIIDPWHSFSLDGEK